MADPTHHLEKMGRELKCPICLSLLNSAVSLTCNHVFCNSCIMKSMKSASDCPVCKVPFRSREVRSAPHMDNLVSIYKSMEVASGFSIFVTQNLPSSTTLSDEQKQVEGDVKCGREDVDRISQGLGKRSISKRKVSRETIKSNMEASPPMTSKPSFPTKKRVQVPQYTISDSLAQPRKAEPKSGENIDDGFKNNSVVLRKNPAVNEKGEPALSPFFWLRDEDAEKLSQDTDVDELLDVTPPNFPTFSDIKLSDDENHSQSSPKEAVCANSNVADHFDSEMFEWTQRACSPELFSSPTKKQAEDTHEIDGIQTNSEATPLSANANEEHSMKNKKGVTNTKPAMGISDEVLATLSSPRVESTKQIMHNKPNKMERNAREATLRKCARKNTRKGFKAAVHSKTLSGKTTQKEALDNKGGVSYFEETGKMNKDGELKSKSDLSVSVRETLDLGDETSLAKLPISLNKKQGSADLIMQKTRKMSTKVRSQCHTDHSLRLKKQKLDSVEINTIKEVHPIQNQMDKYENTLSSFICVPVVEAKNISDTKGTSGKHDKEVKFALSSECNQDLQCKKSAGVLLDGISEAGLFNDHQEGPSYIWAKEMQSTENITNFSAAATESAEKVHDRCNLNYKIQCAFCLSSEGSEASGEMVHYYFGRPVTADYNGGSMVIHSHRNCAEWAPNVYFEDDTAINLEAELARSRRIKCCCCGLRGAALGCYEKSCRKSFHVPCAKLIPQCRWDTENFVMLCPLHVSSKFPNESSKSQERRKKCISKGQTPIECNQVTLKCEIGTHRDWKSCDKLVLCCSALTIGERELVSKFERLSGVTVLKNWDLRITHVIVSTDENRTCRRTLKVLMGILEGKWILNIEWVKACMKAMKLVKEEEYEITADIHGIRDGPRLGRLRILNKEPKIFEGLKFYFMGDFVPSYKGYIQDLIITGGGTILHRKPISGALSLSSSTPSTFIIYSLEMPDTCDPSSKNMILRRRQFDAEALASSTGVKVISNAWVLNSIAACKLQTFAE